MTDDNHEPRRGVRLVCAKCGVYCREVRVQTGEEGRVFQQWTVCAYCGRSELRIVPERE
jgi:hypothetical protein